MYSVLVCRWLPEINHKISITRPFKNQIANETQKPKILFLRRTKLQVAWLLTACSLIWPCSAILRVHSMHAYSILLQGIASTKRLLFGGNQKSRARGGRTLRTVEAAEMGRGSTFIFIWPCNATTLQQTWLYHLTLGLLDTHVSLFRRLVFDNSLSITIQYKSISTDRADNILDCQR